MVFQNYALFPHLTASQNVAFGLEVRGLPRAERERRVNAVLDRVGLAAPERERFPASLSGGQQQRVALARALVIEPDVLLLDEPLANLDRNLRELLRSELRAVQRTAGVAAVLVTHDQEEALAVADLVGVMRAGRLLQVGPPEEVYRRPRTPFVASFLGAANLLPGETVGSPAGVVMIRPEDCRLAPAGCRRVWAGRVATAAFLGATTHYEVACDNGLSLRVRVPSEGLLGVGAPVAVGLPEDRLWAIPGVDEPEPA
jgi:ABC-type Fe3+/spermidine/putrescine transport system ATPase subunit